MIAAVFESAWRKWWICGLLLFATMINYMDRQTLANVAVRITKELQLSEEQYGNLEFAFGWAFAAGSLIFGFAADAVSVRWLYPAVLLGWSLIGFLTGFASDYESLLICRTLLGLFEAGHWPCALKTTQRLLEPRDRAMGNSVLQSGASIGAILTPIVIGLMISGNLTPGAWRQPFFVVGASGSLWIVFWLLLVRRRDFQSADDPQSLPKSDPKTQAGSAAADQDFAGPSATMEPTSMWRALAKIVVDPRFLALLVVVASINTTWQLVRAWLPKFLQQGRGFSETETLAFTSAYFIATDVGCLLVGYATLRMTRRGISTHGSRMIAFTCCAVLTSLTAAVAFLPDGWPMRVLLLVVGAGALGLFPCYYSFTQELSTAHMGKVSGLLGTFAWLVSSPLQKGFGRLADQTGSFDTGFALSGLPPLFGVIALFGLWRLSQTKPTE